MGPEFNFSPLLQRALLIPWFVSFLWFKLVLFLFLTSCIPGVKDPGVRMRLIQSNNKSTEYTLSEAP